MQGCTLGRQLENPLASHGLPSMQAGARTWCEDHSGKTVSERTDDEVPSASCMRAVEACSCGFAGIPT